jgi:transcription elongation factor Elf1
MVSEPEPDPEGAWVTEWAPSLFACRFCNARQVRTRIWQATGDTYERVIVTCGACENSWWINGKPSATP